MIAPTAAEVRSWSRVEWDPLGYAEDTPDPLDELIARAQWWLESVTGRAFSGVPTAMEPGMRRAVQMHVEEQAFESQSDYAETAADGVVSSFSAGSYSESHVDPIKRAQARLLNQNPTLAATVWELMTPDKQDEWAGLLGLPQPPAFQVAEIDWPGWGGPYEPMPGLWGL